MSTVINGFEILYAIGQRESVFEALKSEVNKAAEALLKKQLKAKAMNLAGFRAVREAIADANLALMLDKLTDKELKPLTKKLDPYWPDLATAGANEFRRHLKALGAAEAEATSKPQKPKKAPTKSKSTAKAKSATKPKGTPLKPESMSARSRSRT